MNSTVFDRGGRGRLTQRFEVGSTPTRAIPFELGVRNRSHDLTDQVESSGAAALAEGMAVPAGMASPGRMDTRALAA